MAQSNEIYQRVALGILILVYYKRYDAIFTEVRTNYFSEKILLFIKKICIFWSESQIIVN